MSDTPPTNPVPPTPGEAAKVQPKKETVRIALPPKPTAAPTVRLPAPAAPAPTAAAAPKAPAPPTPPAAAAAPARPAAAAPAAAPAAAMPRPMAAPIASYGTGVSGLDKGLAVAAAVCGLAFLIHVVLIALGIQIE